VSILNARENRVSTRAAAAPRCGPRSSASPGLASLALSLLLVVPAHAAPPIRFSGELGGLVTDVAGRPQPGALVLLLNKEERVLQRVATDTLGAFAFPDLSPDTYAVRISLSNFVPAARDRVLIKPGMRSLLEVNLSRVFSSVQLVSMAPVSGSLMSDSWKWALRADSAMRPIMRFLPVQVGGPSDNVVPGTAIFADSRGMVRISAADGATLTSDGQADLGTQFAFATSLNKDNFLRLAGDVGYAPGSTAPSAAIRTTWSRELPTGDTPEVAVTMRQIYVPLRIGQGVIANNGGSLADGQLPALRTLGTSFRNRKEISDSAELEYGFAYDNVSFLDSGHYFSPWARMAYAVPHGKVDFTWTSGNPHPDLSMEAVPADGSGLSSQGANDLQRELAEVDVLPRVTLADGRARIQRGEDFELGVSQRFGSREFRVAANHETVSNTTLAIESSAPGLFPGDLVPDLFSNSSLFNMGKFEAFDYNASMTQDFGDNYKVSVIYGSEGVLSPRNTGIVETADDLRQLMAASHRPAVTLRASATVRGTGTRVVASYQWTDYQHATPLPMFSTETPRPEPGLNIIVRQPMPAIPGVPWRMEATAELSNLLAQGYLPLMTSGGNRFLVINTPRMIRGGLAFVF